MTFVKSVKNVSGQVIHQLSVLEVSEDSYHILMFLRGRRSLSTENEFSTGKFIESRSFRDWFGYRIITCGNFFRESFISLKSCLYFLRTQCRRRRTLVFFGFIKLDIFKFNLFIEIFDNDSFGRFCHQLAHIVNKIFASANAGFSSG